jgi:nitronate monooxygenase
MTDPVIIQGGTGAGVSGWQLAKAVSQTGQLGIVSGTALDTILSRRLQLGDPGGHIRRALAEFPIPEMADRILARHFIAGGKLPQAPFRMLPLLTQTPSQEQLELIVVANFVEVFLAREDHGGLVGINYLEKIQTPILPSLFGAMIAGVDYVLMGAGIPTAIPGVMDDLSNGNAASLSLKVEKGDTTDSSRFALTRARSPKIEFRGCGVRSFCRSLPQQRLPTCSREKLMAPSMDLSSKDQPPADTTRRHVDKCSSTNGASRSMAIEMLSI